VEAYDGPGDAGDGEDLGQDVEHGMERDFPT
jgi:hypothetical protein